MTTNPSSVRYVAGVPPASPESRIDDRNSFAFSAFVFLRLLALVHLVAFISFWVQLSGLVGPHGILPASAFLSAVRQQLGTDAYLAVPTLCWIFGANVFPHVLCAVGVVAAALLFIGILPAVSLAVLWVCYLSLVGIGQIFFSFQWDILLLEATWLAALMAPKSVLPRWRLSAPSPFARWLLIWLLFRLTFLSGVVKLTSGDPTWRNLTALTFHYETQPLPNPLAWWTHQLPVSFHRVTCAVTFAIELLVPFLLFAPRRLRHIAGLLLIALQLGIAATGNFAFFNFLTIALCILAFDDRCWRALPLIGRAASRLLSAESTVIQPPRTYSAVRITAIAVVLYSVMLAIPVVTPIRRLPAFFGYFYRGAAPFYLVNNYGLFAVMTTERPELIFEGSNDGRTWQPYEFFHKPGDLSRRPTIVAPHQPRLDWQLWFAALTPPEQNPWVLSLCEHLLRGTPQVLAFIRKNPFPERPPRFIRVVRYDYHFTSLDERRRTGNWWRRTPRDIYIAPASLKEKLSNDSVEPRMDTGMDTDEQE